MATSTSISPELREPRDNDQDDIGGSGTGKGSRKRDKIHRRSRWACDDCRGRKIKCDAKMPCMPCRLAHQECTYTFQRKSKYSGPLYVQELEEKVRSLESENQNMASALQTVFPGIDLNSPNLVETIRGHIHIIKKREQHRYKSSIDLQNGPRTGDTSQNSGELLDTMIEASGRLSIDEEGHCQYHGDFAGLAFLHQIDDRCSQLLGVSRPQREPFSSNSPLQQAFGSAIPLYNPGSDPMIMFNLPPKPAAQYLTRIALGDASTLMNFIHVPSFNRLLDRVYASKPESYTTEELAFLPLLYVALAIGELFSGPNVAQTLPGSLSQMKGVKWFRAGQALIDTANCRNMYSLQALVCIIIYLQSSALMHSCYSYISTAISVALQMGLHRLEASARLNLIEQETRKRVFWVLQTMETYVTTLLGLPTVLDDEDVDQELPVGVEDDLITADGILTKSSSPTSPVTAVNAHIRLLKIMRRVVKDIYPRTLRRGTGRAYRVNYGCIVQFEVELDNWFKQIPVLTPEQSLQPETLRTQLLLRLAYAHVQMVLYRPFILHVIRTAPSEPPEMRSFACASACIKAAMQIVWIVEELETRGLLISAYWFTIYITFFAVMALCMFIISNPDDPTVDDALRTAETGRRTLMRLASESVPAEKCVSSLDPLFDKISYLCSGRRKSGSSTRKPQSLTLSNLPTFIMESPESMHAQNQSSLSNLYNDSGTDLTTSAMNPSMTYTSLPPSQHFTYPPQTQTHPQRQHHPRQQQPLQQPTHYNTYPLPLNPQHHPHPPPLQQQSPQNLLAMIHPPLPAYHTYAHNQPSVPIPSPLFGGLGVGVAAFASPTDNEYFPYFNSGWTETGDVGMGEVEGWEEGMKE